MKRIGVVGAGAWGTALANIAASGGLETRIWAREAEVVESINADRRNHLFLPDAELAAGIRATGAMSELGDCACLLLVCPAQHMRAVSKQLADHFAPDRLLVICAKGIEQSTGYLMSEVLKETMPGNPLAVLSGPTFAIETARGLPSAVTVACERDAIATDFINSIGQPNFRPYWTDDLIGAQIGGAVKNVLAIACGICVGLALGENAKAALMTRGMAEIMRFGQSRGAAPETLMGLSGLGDMILTCSSRQSRNMSLGVALGQGESMKDILATRRTVAEGVHSAGIIARMGRDGGVDLPIIESVNRILHKGAKVDDVMRELLNRPFTREGD